MIDVVGGLVAILLLAVIAVVALVNWGITHQRLAIERRATKFWYGQAAEAREKKRPLDVRIIVRAEEYEDDAFILKLKPKNSSPGQPPASII